MADLGSFDYFDQGEPVPVGPIKAGQDTGSFDYFDQGEPFRYIYSVAAAVTGKPYRLPLLGVA